MKSLIKEISKFDLTEQEAVSMFASNIELLNIIDVCYIMKRLYMLEVKNNTYLDQAEFLNKTLCEIHSLINKKGDEWASLRNELKNNNKYSQKVRKDWGLE